MSGVLRRLWQAATGPVARVGPNGRVRWPGGDGAMLEAPHAQLLALAKLVVRDLEETRLNGAAKPRTAADLGRVALLDVGQHSFVVGMLATWLAGSALVPLGCALVFLSRHLCYTMLCFSLPSACCEAGVSHARWCSLMSHWTFMKRLRALAIVELV